MKYLFLLGLVFLSSYFMWKFFVSNRIDFAVYALIIALIGRIMTEILLPNKKEIVFDKGENK